jgi:tetratricopeptide (TPR) repeat protein
VTKIFKLALAAAVVAFAQNTSIVNIGSAPGKSTPVKVKEASPVTTKPNPALQARQPESRTFVPPPGLNLPKLIIELSDAGENAWEHDDHRGVIEAYTGLLKLHPENHIALFRRGYAYLQVGNFAGALRDYNAYIEIDPDNPKAFNNRAVANKALGHQAQFEADVREAQRLEAEPYSARMTRQAARHPYVDKPLVVTESCFADVLKVNDLPEGLEQRKKIAELVQFGCLKSLSASGRVKCIRNLGKFAEVELMAESMTWGDDKGSVVIVPVTSLLYGDNPATMKRCMP